ncbi:MAG: N-acetyltransferase [Woeseiaceae bacterium]|nr:N-acetyltransferase [Woeseiaceae bacterium]
MIENLAIRRSTPGDFAGIEAIYPLAFPDEDLLPVVRDLLADPDIALSLVGEMDGALVGHVIFTRCCVDGNTSCASLLAPLAVTPSHHGQGIGSALVRFGLKIMRDGAIDIVLVLGDPAFYGRLGFATESRIQAPYPLPVEWASAWQSQTLGDSLDDSPTTPAGTLQVPAQWRDPALWSE